VRIDHPAILSADGQVEVELRDGDRISVRASQRDASFVRLQDAAYFYRNLAARLAYKESPQ
jgi:NAD kinase